MKSKLKVFHEHSPTCHGPEGNVFTDVSRGMLVCFSWACPSCTNFHMLSLENKTTPPTPAFCRYKP